MSAMTTGYDDYAARQAAHAQRCSEALTANKTTLFDAMAAAGIVLVTVAFDGCGDEGQMTGIHAFTAANDEIAFPSVDVPVIEANSYGEASTTRSETLEQAFEAVAWALLGYARGGWEDGEGAYGEIRFALADRTVTLDFNERFLDSSHSQSVF